MFVLKVKKFHCGLWFDKQNVDGEGGGRVTF